MMFLIVAALCLFSTVQAQSCKSGYSSVGGSCYKSYTPSAGEACCSRAQGAAACAADDTHLADVTSNAEQDALATWLTSIGAGDQWFGLMSPEALVTSPLSWTDGTPLSAFSGSIPWSGSGRNEDVQCVRMEQTENENFKWSDRTCTLNFGYLCEE